MKRRTLLAMPAALALAPAASAEGQRGGTLNFGIASGDVTVGVDPQVIQGERTEWVLGQIAEGLVNRDAVGNPVPWLANSWAIEDEGRIYRFMLRPGVTFHNGRPMTAEDVKFSIERIQDPRTASFQRQQMSIVQAIETPDAETVVMHLKQPFSPFIAYLAGLTATVIAREGVRDDGSVTKPIATGPFRFMDWQRNGPMTVARYDHYWRTGLPYLDRIAFKPLPDEATRLVALRTGQVDFINGLPPPLVPRLLADKNRGFTLSVSPGTDWHMAIMNTTRPPFDDVRVRQAVSLAIDREQMALARTAGLGRAAADTWPHGSFWSTDETRPKRDLARAKALLIEAGHPEGLHFTIEVRDVFLDDAQVLQQQLKEAGLDATLRVVDWAALRPEMMKHTYDMVVSSAGAYADPDSRYGRFYTPAGAANYFAGGYHNDEVDKLLEQGRVLSDPSRRRSIYRRIEDIVQHEVPHVILYIAPAAYAWSHQLQDLRVGTDGYMAASDGGLAQAWLKQ